MKYARVINGVAYDVTWSDPATLYHPIVASQFETVPDEIDNGWTFDVDLSSWSAPEVVPQPDNQQVSETLVPLSITPRQGRITLSRHGLLSTAEAYFSSLTGDGADEARIEWEYAGEWERSWQTIIDAAHFLGLSDEQIDHMFIEAAQI